ncbi:MAG: carbohydrate deacetylase [Phycisphaerae bacterium]
MLNSTGTVRPQGKQKRLIINADDFGLSAETNRGIIQCRQHGVLTSASLMVRAPAARHAAQYALDDPELSLGLHVDLGEWVLRGDQWVQTRSMVPLDNSTAVRDEIVRQLGAFRKLTGRDPTHLDSHQHVHQDECVKGLMRELADQMGIVLRGDSRHVRFWGAFFGQDEYLRPMAENISVANLITLLNNLEPGVTELSCHPGLDDQLDSDYRAERLLEVQTLCDPLVRRVIEDLGIKLTSFLSLNSTVADA